MEEARFPTTQESEQLGLVAGVVLHFDSFGVFGVEDHAGGGVPDGVEEVVLLIVGGAGAGAHRHEEESHNPD